MRKKHGIIARTINLLRAGVPPRIALAFLTGSVFRPKRSDTPARREFEAFITSKKFSTGWFLGKISEWEGVLDEAGFTPERELCGLEIGSWEGMSALYLLRRFRYIKLTCVDTWDGGDEHSAENGRDLSSLEKIFLENTSEFSDRITRYRGTSAEFFRQAKARSLYDLVYIDGSHFADDVVLDALCSFELLAVGGLMIFDDFTWTKYSRIRNNPATAIAAFLLMKKGLYRVLRIGKQVIIQKTADAARCLQ